MTIKPMKAADLADVDNDVSGLRYPLIGSPKLDGIRCIVMDGVALSNNLKPIRSEHVQEWAAKRKHDGVDCELICGAPTGGNVLGRSMNVTAFDGGYDFRAHVFDFVDPRFPYRERLDFVGRSFDYQHPRVSVLSSEMLYDAGGLLKYEQKCIVAGYEGIMLRDPFGPYKFGRSTLKEGYLIKLKRFMDGEGVVTGVEEAETNTNEATIDELGRTKRSSAKAGKVPKGMVGTVLVEDPKWGELRLAPGRLTHEQRIEFWRDPRKILGRLVHWRSFGYGIKDKPRFARFYSFREDGV